MLKTPQCDVRLAGQQVLLVITAKKYKEPTVSLTINHLTELRTDIILSTG